MIDVALLFLLVLVNAFLAMSEIAVISSRKSRLQKLADDKIPGAQSALKLSHEPANFLSIVQVGLTTVSILSGAIGETALARPLALWLADFSFLAPYARGLSLTLVVVGLTYFSVVIGELVPKRLALQAPESIASFIATPMTILASLTRPLVWLFSASSSLILRLMRMDKNEDPPVSDAEINVLMGQGAEAGIFHESEQAIVSNVLSLNEQRIGGIMTHRSDIYVLDLNASDEDVRASLAQCTFGRVVVCENGLENICGILRMVDLVNPVLAGDKLDIRAFLRPPLYVPEGASTANVMEIFRKTRQQCALIVDEYGELQGLVTLMDVFAAIVGDIPSSDFPEDQEIVERADGSWLVDGSIAIERFKSQLDIRDALPGEDENAFNTLGGLVMYVLGKIPRITDQFDAAGYRFEVIDMDRNRVDKVLLIKQDEPQ